jgi:site-specific DNA-cytosine methylase
LNVLSLFDGISCGQVALERAGIQVDKYYASEINKYAIQVTQKNYPNTIQLGDITKIDGKQLKNIDLLIGGSPCQGFSFAGKQLNFNDIRSALFFEYVRLLKECKPTYFLLENVKMKKEHQDVISKYLGVEPIEINSALVSAQNRKRLYWTNIPGIEQPEDKRILIADILTEKNWNTMILPSTQKYINEIIVKFGYLPQMFNPYNRSKIERKHPTLTATGNRQTTSAVLFFQRNGYLRITCADEWELLQTLPCQYTSCLIDEAKRKNVIANGWTVDVIAHILKNAHPQSNEK